MSFKALFDSLVQYVRRLPIARMIRPLWQGALIDQVQRRGDELQSRVRRQLPSVGVKAIDHNIDKWQKDLIDAIEKLPLPDAIEDKMQAIVEKQGDKMQAALQAAVESGAPSAVDAAFDAAQMAIIDKINKL